MLTSEFIKLLWNWFTIGYSIHVIKMASFQWRLQLKSKRQTINEDIDITHPQLARPWPH